MANLKDNVTKIDQKINKKIDQYQRELYKLDKSKKRKAETHFKIQMGGLVVKSKMAQYPKDVILGALMDAFHNINQPDQKQANGYLDYYKFKGEAEFLKKE